MKTILIRAIDPCDGVTRTNQILVSRIVGWYTRHRYYCEVRDSATDQFWRPYTGPTTIISLDSGAEYEIAESQEEFRNRLEAIIDAPVFGFTGFKPYRPTTTQTVRYFNCHSVCAECNRPMTQSGREGGQMLISCRGKDCKQYGLVAKIPALIDPVVRIEKD